MKVKEPLTPLNVCAMISAVVANVLQRMRTTTGQKEASYSRRLTTILAQSLVQAVLAGGALVLFPLLFYANIPSSEPVTFLKYMLIGWYALLHISIWPVAAVTFGYGILVAWHNNCCAAEKNNKIRDGCAKAAKKSPCQLRSPVWTSIYIVLFFSAGTVVGSQLQVVVPSWIWNPFLWGNFNIYKPDDIAQALQGLCLDESTFDSGDKREPLCLSNGSWKTLSSGALSNRNPQDVDTVRRGLQYAKEESGGLVINIMSRDTIDSIAPLRKNVEGLVPFFRNKLSVVVYENDSKDGSRDAFKKWASEADGYKVDLISCGEENPDCIFGISHRYDSTEAKEYFTSSAIGRMAEFRQKIVDYLMESQEYKDFSHMIVVDLDLAVSLSPLGVLHTLGKVPDSAVASSGRQTWPGSFGTIVPPYDFSAFRAIETPTNAHLLAMHQNFCELLPAGDRWRNQCDAVSSMHLMLVLQGDWMSKSEPYRVASAFNGATMYPLKLVRESNSKYDPGEDGQRCEHIGFNLSLKKPMFVNPKWAMNIKPGIPGGPTGPRALKNVMRIVFMPRLALTVFFQNVVCMMVCVYSIMILGMHAGYPLIVAARRCRRTTRMKEMRLPIADTEYDRSLRKRRRVVFAPSSGGGAVVKHV